MRKLLPLGLLFLSFMVVNPARADDSAGAEESPKQRTGSAVVARPSRAVPITMIAIGATSIVGGTVAIAVDQDEAANAPPVIRNTAPVGVVAVTSGVILAGVGGFLRWKYGYAEDPTTEPVHTKPWALWTGLGALGVGVVGAGAAAKFGVEGQDADDELARVCATMCTGQQAKTLIAKRDSANRRAIITGSASGVVAIGGIALLLIWNHSERGVPTVQVTSSGASVGWSSTF